MKKVLLISANTLKMPYPVYPLGLDYVAGSLDCRYSTKIVDLNTIANLDDLGALSENFPPILLVFPLEMSIILTP